MQREAHYRNRFSENFMLAKLDKTVHYRPMTQYTTFQQTVSFFLRELEGGNKSQLTLTAYKTDLSQFFNWLAENDATVTIPAQVTRGHVNEYLAFLSSQGRSGVTRARKLAALKSFFTYLKDENVVNASPADSIHMP